MPNYKILDFECPCHSWRGFFFLLISAQPINFFVIFDLLTRRENNGQCGDATEKKVLKNEQPINLFCILVSLN